MVYDRKVVGNKDIGQSHLLLKILHQIQDLGLDGNVQGRHRLVTDDQLGLHGQGAGDADTLTAAAVQLMGVGVDQTVCQSNDLHQLMNSLCSLFGIRDQLLEL